ncbi:hypothetical protein KGP36_05585, partial [Patescibacteria group bacterium]|nr:hypothetical protein [Patescibacteria group bacterium]
MSKLRFPKPIQDTLTHSLGLMKCLELSGELKGKSLVIRNTQVEPIELMKDEINVCDFLNDTLRSSHSRF